MNKNNSFLSVLEYYRKSKGPSEDWNFFNGTRDLDNSFVQFKNNREQDLPDELTYYCSDFVAESIIHKGFIWLNDIRKMNDESEMVFAVEHIANRLSRMKNDSVCHPNLLTVFDESYLDLIDSSIRKGSDAYGGKLILGMSLTEAKDDASMWERYAENGKGVSIHFNSKILSRVITTATLFFPNPLVFEHGLAKICYADENCCCL
jgi:hypothetical protein